MIVSVGQGRTNTRAVRLSVYTASGVVEGFAAALSAIAPGEERWLSPHAWSNDNRSKDSWVQASGIPVDVDYKDGTLNEEGNLRHVSPPKEVLERVSEALINGEVPGSIFHFTPRGLRVFFVFDQPNTDAQSQDSAAKAAASMVDEALRRMGVGDGEVGHPGYRVDVGATVRRSQFFWAPYSTVNGVERRWNPIVLRDQPYKAADLAQLTPRPSDHVVTDELPRSHPRAETDFDRAVERWNADHPGDWPTSSGTCPICGHNGCFGRLPKIPAKWSCHSTSHPEHAGKKQDGCMIGDALDIEVNARSLLGSQGRARVLRDDGYLADRNDYNQASEPDTTEREPSSDDEPIEVETRIVVDGNLAEVIERSVEVASAAPEIYSRGGSLVEVIIDEPRAKFGIKRGGKMARAVDVPEVRLREILARDAKWFQYDRKGEPVDAIPPEWAAKGVRARGTWPKARRLSAVIEAPTLRPDGSVLQQDGYDPVTQVYLQSSVQVSVPEAPTVADVEAARDRLMDLLVDFPLTPEGKSVIVAAICTVVCRSAIDGNVPMFVIDANVAGAGKGKLADVASLVALGRQVSRAPYSDDDEEVRKQITSFAITGDPLVLFDNVDVPLGCASLDLAITAPSWKGRVLGESRNVDVDLVTVWMATGNNISIRGDLARRVLVARLLSESEHPELREDFQHPDIESYTFDHRAELLCNVLTVMRGFVIAGRPTMGLRPMGSFESWSKLVRAAVVWAGLPDPCATVSVAQSADTAADVVRAVVEGWPVFDDGAVTAGDLVDKAGVLAEWREVLTAWVRPPKGERLPDVQAVGYALKRIKDRVVSGFQIVEAKSIGHKKRWARVRVGS